MNNQEKVEYWNDAFEAGRRMSIRAQQELLRLVAVNNVVIVDFTPKSDDAA